MAPSWTKSWVGAEGGFKPGANQDLLRLGTIEIADSGITERTREGHRSVFGPRAGIERLAVAHGFTSERPIAALVASAVFLGGGGTLLVAVMSAEGGYIPGKFLAAIGFLVAIGMVFLWNLIHRGRYLRVDTTRGPRKLLLDGVTDRIALRSFLQLARSRLGYSVDFTELDDA